MTPKEKRTWAILNRVVKHKGANFRDRWNELYRVFRETYHIDLKARKEGYNLKQTRPKDRYKSVLEYAVGFDFIDDLYKVALKLYETDMTEIIEQIKKVA
jgi:anti-repressor protein